jgi:hypothetical protein
VFYFTLIPVQASVFVLAAQPSCKCRRVKLRLLAWQDPFKFMELELRFSSGQMRPVTNSFFMFTIAYSAGANSIC